MKLRTFLMAGLVTLSLVLPASALTLSVDGRDRTAEAKTTAIQNTTYVSLRSVATMLDPTAQVDWKDGKAWVTTDKLTLTARPGDEYIQVNGRYIYMANGVKAVNGSTMVAIRPFASAMGGKVDWVGQTSTVLLTSGDGIPEEPTYDQEDCIGCPVSSLQRAGVSLCWGRSPLVRWYLTGWRTACFLTRSTG